MAGTFGRVDDVKQLNHIAAIGYSHREAGRSRIAKVHDTRVGIRASATR